MQAAICQAGALERFPALLQGGLTSGGLIVEVPPALRPCTCMLRLMSSQTNPSSGCRACCLMLSLP